VRKAPVQALGVRSSSVTDLASIKTLGFNVSGRIQKERNRSAPFVCWSIVVEEGGERFRCS
jgi:hypothetical protein